MATTELRLLSLRLIETRPLTRALVCLSVRLVDEAVSPIHRSSPAGVHHVHLVAAVRLRHPVRHVAAGAAAQSLVVLPPAAPFPVPRPNEGQHGQSQRQGEQEGDGQGRRSVLQGARRHVDATFRIVPGFGVGDFHTQVWEGKRK